YHVSASNSASAMQNRAATLVDARVPPGERVAVIWGEAPSPEATPRQLYFWLMVTEFFNSSLGDVYRFGPATYHERFLPTVPVALRPDRTVVDTQGRPVSARYALVACETDVVGQVVGDAPGG